MVGAKTQLSRGAFFILALLSHNSIVDLAKKRQSLGPRTRKRARSVCVLATKSTDLEAGVFAFPGQPPKERDQEMTTQSQAMSRVKVAVRNGTLTRLDRCQICNKIPTDRKTRSIVAHHWNGYDDPLNVWWCCRSCNGYLEAHDGSLNLEQAKAFVKERWRAKLFFIH